MQLDEVISDGIKEKERDPEKLPTICFYIGNKTIAYTAIPIEEIPPETEIKYASDYFG